MSYRKHVNDKFPRNKFTAHKIRVKKSQSHECFFIIVELLRVLCYYIYLPGFGFIFWDNFLIEIYLGKSKKYMKFFSAWKFIIVGVAKA